MILSVMTFLLVVSGLAAIAAWCAERGLRGFGAPTRLVWLVALALGPSLLIAAVVLRRSVGRVVGDVGSLPVGVVDLQGLTVGNGATSVAAFAEPLAVGLWAAATLGFLAVLLRARLGLARAMGGWRTERVQGRDVLVARDLGPAVTGAFRSRIVLPDWVLGLPGRQIRMILTHEEEHVRARDVPLLAVALTLVAATAWNPVGWWLLRRLRGAVEVDCDRRVLRREPDPAAYGESLLTVAGRAGRPTLALAAFTEAPHTLERRILAMSTRINPRTRLAGTGLLAAAILVGAQACGVESPVTSDDAASPEPALAEVPAELAAEPTFTPFTVAPEIRNRDEVIASMEAEYPPLLREAGIGGTVRVYFLISETGRVADVRIDQSSGHEALDRAALDVASVYRFTPALNREQPTPVWVSFPITFAAEG
ncbi:MAG: M56 family metallopeptidase [Gemmatimonadota bacterium]|nr:M56 family metallopeptidase [Gemmatimonadota bacterium]